MSDKNPPNILRLFIYVLNVYLYRGKFVAFVAKNRLPCPTLNGLNLNKDI